jgi:hypothetical protein
VDWLQLCCFPSIFSSSSSSSPNTSVNSAYTHQPRCMYMNVDWLQLCFLPLSLPSYHFFFSKHICELSIHTYTRGSCEYANVDWFRLCFFHLFLYPLIPFHHLFLSSSPNNFCELSIHTHAENRRVVRTLTWIGLDCASSICPPVLLSLDPLPLSLPLFFSKTTYVNSHNTRELQVGECGLGSGLRFPFIISSSSSKQRM